MERLGTGSRGTAWRRATGRDLRVPLYRNLGYDDATGRADAHGQLAATPMARIRDSTMTVLLEAGIAPDDAAAALLAAWHAPDPVELAVPLADLAALFGALRATGRRLAVATSTTADPPSRTLAAAGRGRPPRCGRLRGRRPAP